MFRFNFVSLAFVAVIAPLAPAKADGSYAAAQHANTTMHANDANNFAAAELSHAAHLREMVQATVGVVVERETRASRFVGRILRAVGVKHHPRYERDLAGSGVVVDKDNGLIVSSAHLLRDDGRVVVIIYDDLLGDKLPEEVTGEIAAVDEATHALVLAVDPEALRYTHKATWGQAQLLDLDDVVISISSIGGPIEKEKAVGIIINQNVSLSARASYHVKEVHEDDLFVASSSSSVLFGGVGPGAPVFAHRGPLVGIVTLQTAGLLFAVPFERIAPLVERAITDRAINFPGMP